jgi:hypothetical protein
MLFAWLNVWEVYVLGFWKHLKITGKKQWLFESIVVHIWKDKMSPRGGGGE